jgi:hypothetical protein
LCNQMVSPPRLRPKGLQKADRAGVGSGHGAKVSTWCIRQDDVDSMDKNVEDICDDDDDNDDEEDTDYKKPRIRRDRKQNTLPDKRKLRSTSVGNNK